MTEINQKVASEGFHFVIYLYKEVKCEYLVSDLLEHSGYPLTYPTNGLRVHSNRGAIEKHCRMIKIFLDTTDCINC